jgi:hypothetical protein
MKFKNGVLKVKIIINIWVEMIENLVAIEEMKL